MTAPGSVAGSLVSDTSPALLPDQRPLVGRFITLRRLTYADREPLYQSIGMHEAFWDTIPRGPYPTLESFDSLMLELLAQPQKNHCYTIVSNVAAATTGTITIDSMSKATEIQVLGMIGLLECDPANKTTELGAVFYGHGLQRSRAATEVVHLLMSYAFNTLGYRRIEWKTNARNLASRRAAERYGFTPEGVLRQHMIVKGLNRDTAVYSILDCEWKAGGGCIEKAYVAWLRDENFDDSEKQRRRLEEIRNELSTQKILERT